MSKYQIFQDFQNNACSAVTLGLVSNSASRVLKYRTKIFFLVYVTSKFNNFVPTNISLI